MSFQLFLGRFRGLCSTISIAPLTCCRRSSDRSPLPMGRLSGKGLAFSITKLGLSSPAVIGVWAAVFFTSRIHMGVMHKINTHSWTCMDLYVFATPYRITWDYYFSARDHALKFKSWEEEAELEYKSVIKGKAACNLCIFMPSGMLGTLLSLADILLLFSNTNANLEFLKKHMGATFEKCSQPWRATINPDNVHSGDFLALSKIRGRWGGFETLEKWVTGAFAGHTAVCLKDEFGNLWVGESGHENEKGEEIIVVIQWDEWWELSLKDESNPQVVLLPLHPDVRAKFNSTAAWEYAWSMAGKPYGYHNMIFSWIDTIADNYPPPLDAHLVFLVQKPYGLIGFGDMSCSRLCSQVISVMFMRTRVQLAYAASMWNEALNKRLGTENYGSTVIIIYIHKKIVHKLY
ncbi:hypothetical protein HYC85_027053 [Camellia sinensis]|uniref:Uncharacterized protein n=1 Tax=Camellia sinensis TaxID=4442 RepID=A0A7J7G995_CAMSI|nr:hypothetical protein HYC85_027053 [Camellia sinensis]